MNFTIIGISDAQKPFIAPEAMEVLRQANIFSGGRRHHDIVRRLLPEGSVWIDITVPLDNVFAEYAKYEGEEIVVFASGDPLFFGFANTVRRRLPDARVRVFPTFNSLQMLAHRLLMEYDDMRIVSLTGRSWTEFDRALIEGVGKIGVLTDRTHTPQAIAERMADYGYTDYKMFVGECLGSPVKERVYQQPLPLPDGERNSPLSCGKGGGVGFPNCLILCATAPRRLCFGLPDSEFMLLDGRERMITKMPIRLLTLQALELCRHTTFWDIGFCTGSVSIEARLQFPKVQVVAFEIRPEGATLIDVNARHFGAPGITSVIGDFLETNLDHLPRPDAVFIGGHGGRLRQMMQRIVPLLADGGCIVINSVTATSHDEFIHSAKVLGLTLAAECRIAINDYNPITILKATK